MPYPQHQGSIVIDGHPTEPTWYARTVRVAAYGADFNRIAAAIAWANAQAPTITNPIAILIYPGTYAESNLVMADNVHLIGQDADTCFIVANDAVNPIISSAVRCILTNLTIGNNNAAQPAIRVTANVLSLHSCLVYGTGAGDAIQMRGGTLVCMTCDIGPGDIDLSTAGCTLSMQKSRIDTDGIDTAGNFAHVLFIEDVDFNAVGINSAAIGATVLNLRSCTNVGIVSNAGIGAFAIRGSEVATITNTNAAGTIVITGGSVNACGGSVGSVIWKKQAQQYEVIAGMKIQHAITAAAADAPAPSATAPYTILIHPGIYTEQITAVAWVNIKGIGPKGSVVIQQVDADVVTLASDVEIENATVRITTPTGAHSLIKDAGVSCDRVKLIDIVLAYTTPAAIANVGVLLTGGSWISMERCFANWAVPGTGNEKILSVTTAPASVLVDGCNFRNTNSTAGSLINCAFMFAVIFVINSRLEGRVSHLVASAGTIRVANSQYRSVVRTAAGNIVDESPEAKDYIYHVVKLPCNSLDNIATRTAVAGIVTLGGSGQLRLRCNDAGMDIAGIENNADAAGALDSSFAPAYTPRYSRQVSANAFRATTMIFFGLRQTLGGLVPVAAEHHAGFIWDGANFKASSTDGAVIQATNLTLPSIDTQHQLEVIVFGGVKVEYYVDGVLVATHAARVPTTVLDFQELEYIANIGALGNSDITLRNGFAQECSA